jgi:hypothetical protein
MNKEGQNHGKVICVFVYAYSSQVCLYAAKGGLAICVERMGTEPKVPASI